MADQIISKKCTGCKEIKPLSGFHKDKSAKDGHTFRCKQCQKQYYENHKVHQLQCNKEYRRKHRPQQLQYERQYYQNHKAEKLRNQNRYLKTIRGHLRGVWRNMFYRCNNHKHPQYKNYGGRGIKIKFTCFDDFFNYIIKKLKADPRGLTIDRINNDGHYEPGNIRFISQADNNRNQRKSPTHFL